MNPQMLKKISTALALVLVLVLDPAAGQQFSYDGNLWYEIEVSIFTNEFLPGFSTEQSREDRLNLRYLPRLRQLRPSTEGLMIRFPGEVSQAADLTAASFPSPSATSEFDETVPRSPAVPGAYRLPDIQTEAWFSLDSRFQQFREINSELASSSEHRLLWHKSWRQPVLPRSQVQALFVAGGQLYGDHRELEGSLRFASDRNQVLLDTNLWLNRFSNGPVVVNNRLQLPALPMQETAMDDALDQEDNAGISPPPGTRVPVQVWQLEQTRDLNSNQFYYLDHPAIGLIVQIRPYVLPLPEEDQVQTGQD
jgi:hypothetical protein